MTQHRRVTPTAPVTPIQTFNSQPPTARSIRIFATSGGHSREVYTTKRMQVGVGPITVMLNGIYTCLCVCNCVCMYGGQSREVYTTKRMQVGVGQIPSCICGGIGHPAFGL